MFSGFPMFPDPGRNFQARYKCFSVSMLPGNERKDVEKGGKIIMPPSALDSLTRLNVDYPMLFKLTNQKHARISHCGVLEFVADEGKCYLPHWMMQNMLLEEGDLLNVESVSLLVATFSKFQPLSTDFLDITNPKAVLENALRNFACLTTNDVIAIKYNNKVYELCVLETRPGNAVSIIECDMNVEFEAPVGWKEPSMEPKKQEEVVEEEILQELPTTASNTFSGSGMRLDGKKKRDDQENGPAVKRPIPRGIPDYEYKFGVLKFDRSIVPISDRVKAEPLPEDAAKKSSSSASSNSFDGKGSMLKSQKY